MKLTKKNMYTSRITANPLETDVTPQRCITETIKYCFDLASNSMIHWRANYTHPKSPSIAEPCIRADSPKGHSAGQGLPNTILSKLDHESNCNCTTFVLVNLGRFTTIFSPHRPQTHQYPTEKLMRHFLEHIAILFSSIRAALRNSTSSFGVILRLIRRAHAFVGLKIMFPCVPPQVVQNRNVVGRGGAPATGSCCTLSQIFCRVRAFGGGGGAEQACGFAATNKKEIY